MCGLQITGSLSCVFTVDITNLTLSNKDYIFTRRDSSAEVTQDMKAQKDSFIAVPCGLEKSNAALKSY